ncbi:SPOC domain-like protein [Ceraceosorus guamensis]|uniref:ATP-dependent DNA helicase II subunit 1 n=1 Tax=Ceraceosorus guamensis TaxID=1522189 RepID=A0A316VQL2_9BASI|nr:SPOC domain-like protein [Ceraceosorus guamensis]PWN39348.1 SPOC domain-like protein [Ceraceosorus guamensis]
MAYYNRAGGSQRRDDPDPDEIELVNFDEESSKDVILFLIDAGKRMQDTLVPSTATENAVPGSSLGAVKMDENAPRVSLLHRALEGAVSLMRNKLVASPRDLVGIMLYNTEDTSMAELGKTSIYEHTYMVEPVGMVDIGNLAGLIDDLDLSREDPTYLRTRYKPMVTEMRIHHAWMNAGAIIKQYAKTGSKRIFFVTQNDDPYAGKMNRDGVGRHLADMVREMAKRQVEFEPFLLETDNQPFDIGKFWGPIFAAGFQDGNMSASSMSRSQTPADLGQGPRALKLEDLDEHVAKTHTPKRVNFRGPMKFGGGCTIGVKGYGMVKKAEKGNPIKVMEDKSAESDGGPMSYLEIDVRTEQWCKDTGRTLNPSEIETAFSFGTDSSLRSKVRFSPAEVKRLRTFGQKPGIEILGFKPNTEDSLSYRDNIKISYFLYPFDEAWRNSKRFFSALLSSMIRKNVMAIGIFMRVQGQQPVFCAILPQTEERERGISPGMHLIPLPFADDIRDLPEKHAGALEAEQAQVEAAKAIIKAYSKAKEFQPEDFPNPALAHHYEVLINTALGKPLPGSGDMVDATIPNYAGIKKRVGPRIAQFNDLIGNDGRTDVVFAPSGRGGAAVASFSSADQTKLLERHANEQIAAMKVDDLKAALDFYRQPKSGRKAELVERLEQYLDKLVAKKQASG